MKTLIAEVFFLKIAVHSLTSMYVLYVLDRWEIFRNVSLKETLRLSSQERDSNLVVRADGLEEEGTIAW